MQQRKSVLWHGDVVGVDLDPNTVGLHPLEIHGIRLVLRAAAGQLSSVTVR